MDSIRWDERYAGFGGTRSVGPVEWVANAIAPLAAGRALDLGAGDGRHTIALARCGWDVTAVDFSDVALKRLADFARVDLTAGSGHIHLVKADVTTYRPDAQAYDLVLLAYLHLPQEVLEAVLATVADALAPGGALLMVGHARSGYGRGTGGPDDPAILWDADELADLVRTSGLEVEVAEPVDRLVIVDDLPLTAIDTTLVARKDHDTSREQK